MTTSAEEWEFVVRPKEGHEYAERSGLRDQMPEWCRTPVPLAERQVRMVLSKEARAQDREAAAVQCA